MSEVTRFEEIVHGQFDTGEIPPDQMQWWYKLGLHEIFSQIEPQSQLGAMAVRLTANREASRAELLAADQLNPELGNVAEIRREQAKALWDMDFFYRAVFGSFYTSVSEYFFDGSPENGKLLSYNTAVKWAYEDEIKFVRESDSDDFKESWIINAQSIAQQIHTHLMTEKELHFRRTQQLRRRR